MDNIYTTQTYSENNPTWHEEDSDWKASQVLRMVTRNNLSPKTVSEIGCGVGKILEQMRIAMPDNVGFSGFDIAKDAISKAKTRETDRLKFYQKDLLQSEEFFDLMLVMDVIEHIPDYLGFLEKCRKKAIYKIYHIPLDIHVSSTLRGTVTCGRKSVGHLHYFSAESAIASLEDTGHEIVDRFYTDGARGLSHLHRSIKRTAMNIPRMILGKISTPLSARLLGGYSLLVLTK